MSGSPDTVRIGETLWILQRGSDTMTCLVVSDGHGGELHVLVNGNLYLTETYAHREGLLGLADTLHRNLLRREWRDTDPRRTA